MDSLDTDNANSWCILEPESDSSTRVSLRDARIGDTRLLDRKDDEWRKLSSCDESIGECVGDTATLDECSRDLDSVCRWDRTGDFVGDDDLSIVLDEYS